MKLFRVISLISLFIISFLSINAQKTYIWCGKLIDGHNLVVQPTMTIIIEGNKIVSVEKGYTNGKGEDINIDLKNKTVLPGFIDCHVHLETQFNKNSLLEQFTLSEADLAFNSVVNAKTTLLAGFTTVRDCGGTGVNTSLRNAIAKGKIIGPTLLSSGKAISASGGHMDPSDGFREDAFRDLPSTKDGVADGKDECIKAVRLQFKQGADFIKIASTGGVLDLSKDGSGAQFTIEEIKTIVETAKDYGMKVACHAHGAEGIRRAILGGVASIEHGTLMNEEDMELAKKYNTYYVPTLTAQHSCMDSARIPGYFPKVIAEKALSICPKGTLTFSKAYKKGLKIAFGTDAGVFAHGKNAKEFTYMVEAGMSPMDAVLTATKVASELLGISEERGTLEKGKMADLVAVDEDPMVNISTLEKVCFVMKEGKIYKN